MQHVPCVLINHSMIRFAHVSFYLKGMYVQVSTYMRDSRARAFLLMMMMMMMIIVMMMMLMMIIVMMMMMMMMIIVMMMMMMMMMIIVMMMMMMMMMMIIVMMMMLLLRMWQRFTGVIVIVIVIVSRDSPARRPRALDAFLCPSASEHIGEARCGKRMLPCDSSSYAVGLPAEFGGGKADLRACGRRVGGVRRAHDGDVSSLRRL
jgi:hypothetical protein